MNKKNIFVSRYNELYHIQVEMIILCDKYYITEGCFCVTFSTNCPCKFRFNVFSVHY